MKIILASAGISSRMAEVSFSAPFLREMRTIALAKNYVENSRVPFSNLERRLTRMNFHLIEAEDLMAQLSIESKLNSSSAFLTMLRDHGRARAWTGRSWPTCDMSACDLNRSIRKSCNSSKKQTITAA